MNGGLLGCLLACCVDNNQVIVLGWSPVIRKNTLSPSFAESSSFPKHSSWYEEDQRSISMKSEVEILFFMQWLMNSKAMKTIAHASFYK